MLIIGLTGSIGMGKSTAATRFKEVGIAVCDVDGLVHDLYRGPVGPAVAKIEAAFPGTTGPEGVDRQKLSAALLLDPSGFERLEKLVHPLVRSAEKQFLQAQEISGAAMAVLEIPLLYEAQADQRVDVVIVVSAPAAMQRERVLAREGMTTAKLDQLLARQMPDSVKRARADYVVDTSGTIEESRGQVDEIITELALKRGSAYKRHWE